MGCACKAEQSIAKYYDKADKIHKRKKTFSEWVGGVSALAQTLLIRVIAFIFIIVFCPLLLIYIACNVIVGRENLAISLPKPLQKYFRKNVKKYGKPKLPN